MKLNREFTVGLFALLAVGILAGFTVSLRNWDFLTRRSTYYILFRRVKKLDVGATVLANGVQVGEVARLEFVAGDDPVKVTIRVDRRLRLFSNSKVQVSLAGVIGDTTINIDTGDPEEEGATILPPKSTIIGLRTIELDKLVDELSMDLKQTFDGINRILNNPENQAALNTILTNSAQITEKMDETFRLINEELKPTAAELRATAQKLNGFIDELSGMPASLTDEVTQARRTFDKTAGQFGSAANEIGSAADEIGAVAHSLRSQLNETAQHVQSAAETIDATLGENRESIKEAVTELRKAAASINELAERTRKGEGTLGALLVDRRPFDQLQQILSAVSQALTGRRETTFPIMSDRAPRSTPYPEPTSP